MSTIRIPRLWTAAQACAVGTAFAVVALLIARPELGLFLTWDLLVPLVPAVLLVAPGLWRNVCPVAVVHQIPARFGIGGTRRLPRRLRRAAPSVAAGLFFVIVPLRHALFNESGIALALFVLGILSTAVVGALVLSGKSGWCATFCPVLPVERLYGQQPGFDVPHAHCRVCSGCIRSCYDLKPERSMEELLDRQRLLPGPDAWPATRLFETPMGIFAALFPGYVLGYFTVDPNATVPVLYLWTIGFGSVSAVALFTTQRLTQASSRTLARISAAAAVAFYYWFSVPEIAAAAHVLLEIAPAPTRGIAALRAALLLLATVWLLDASRRERARDPLRAARKAEWD